MSWLDDIGDAASKSFAGDKLLLAGIAAGVVVVAGVAWWLLGQFGVVDPIFGCAKCEAAKRARLVLVEFADREGSLAAFSGTRSQYVNLTRYGTGDPQVTTGYQAYRRPQIVVKVTPPSAVTVKLRLVRTEVPGGFPAGSEILSGREQGIEHLQWQSDVMGSVETDANGDGLLDPGMTLPQMAGFLYHVEGSVGGKPFVRSSNSVAIKRRFAIRQVVRFKAGQAAAAAAIAQLRPMLDPLDVEYHDHPPAYGDEFGVRQRDDEYHGRPGLLALDTPDEIKAFNPHSLAIVVGEFAPTKVDSMYFEVELPRKPGTRFPDKVDIVLKYGDIDCRLVPLTDGTAFVSGTVSDGGTASAFDLKASDVSGLTTFSSRVTVNLARILPSLPAAATVLTVGVKLKVMDSWAIGWAYGDRVPVIYLNMRDPNLDGDILAPADALALVVHELGHKLRLTSDGRDAIDPDAQSHYYPTGKDGVSHVGPHCAYGVTPGLKLTSPQADKTATCAMWGALTGVTSYCPECRTSLRKVNLTAGL